MASDATGFDTDCSVMLHMNGNNGSTTFVDDSINALTVTPQGTVQISTAQSKFGGASGLFNGSTDYLDFPSSPLFAVGTGKFTIDFQIRPAVDGAAYQVCDTRTVNTNTSGFLFQKTATNVMFFQNGGGVLITGTLSVNSGTWTHITVVGNGGAPGSRTLQLFVNGSQDGVTVSNDYNFTDQTLRLGARYFAPPTAFYNGNLDEFRFVKGTQVWTSDFTPPTAEYTPKFGTSTSYQNLPLLGVG